MVLYEGFPANSCSWQPKENIENTKHLKDFEAKEEKSVQQASKKSKRAEMQQTRANKKEAAAVAIKVEAPEPTREGMQCIDSTIEQDNHCVKSMWGENHAHECFATLQIWLLVP
jgi:hypothetical protein